MAHGFPVGTMLGARITFPADWPADPMPADSTPPVPAQDWPATPYVPRHARPAYDYPMTPRQRPATFTWKGTEYPNPDYSGMWADKPDLVQCWNATHPADAHSERDDCDDPFPVEAKPMHAKPALFGWCDTPHHTAMMHAINVGCESPDYAPAAYFDSL